MTRALCIFEDRKVENFYPLTLTRPVYDLRCGISTLGEKIGRISQENLHLLCREYLSKVTSQRIKKARVNQLEDLNDKDMLFVNGRLLFLDEEIALEGEEEIAIQKQDIVYARLNKNTLEKLSFGSAEKIEQTLAQAKQMVKVEEVEVKLLEYPWDLIRLNGEAIKADFKLKGKSGIEGRVDKGAYLINASQIYIGKESRIEPGVVLNAEEGPIYIGEEVKVHLSVGAIDTGEVKIGSFIGDHTKTGIGTLLNTGCVIGVACNIFGGGTTPKFIPSFSWGGEKKFVKNRLDKVVEVARLVMERRGVRQTEADRDLLKKVYELTAEERTRR